MHWIVDTFEPAVAKGNLRPVLVAAAVVVEMPSPAEVLPPQQPDVAPLAALQAGQPPGQSSRAPAVTRKNWRSDVIQALLARLVTAGVRNVVASDVQYVQYAVLDDGRGTTLFTVFTKTTEAADQFLEQSGGIEGWTAAPTYSAGIGASRTSKC